MKPVPAPHQLLHYIAVDGANVVDECTVNTNITNRPADYARRELAAALSRGAVLYLKVGEPK